MAFVDNIIGAIIITGLFLIAGIVIYADISGYAQRSLETSQRFFRTDQHLSTLSTTIGATEPTSNLPLRALIGRALANGRQTIAVGNQTVDVGNATGTVLDRLVGEDGYYLDAEWDVQRMTLSFVLDGSPTVEAEREKLKTILPGLVTKVESRLPSNGSVTAQVFILSQDTAKCNIFEDLGAPWLTCRTVGFEDMYELSRNPYIDIEPPTPQSFDSFNEWEDTSPALPRSTFTEADWASGSGFASYWFNEQANTGNVSWLHLIFPVSDEFATSSVPDSCFQRTDRDWRDRTYAWVCSICASGCNSGPGTPAARSQEQIDTVLPIFREQGDIINPIYSFDCDYNPPRFLEGNSFKTSETTSEFGPYSGTWCGSPGCPGCNGKRPNVCFQPNATCQEKIRDQMGQLANETGGVTTSLTDVDELEEKILSMVDDVLRNNPHRITAGTRYDSRDRLVTKQRIYLPNGKQEEVELWVYED